jgi:hypothetical protein
VLTDGGCYDERLLLSLLKPSRDARESPDSDVADDPGFARLDRDQLSGDVADEDRLEVERRIVLGTILEFAVREALERLFVHGVVYLAANLRKPALMNRRRVHQEESADEDHGDGSKRKPRQADRPCRRPASRGTLTPPEKTHGDRYERDERGGDGVEQADLFGEAPHRAAEPPTPDGLEGDEDQGERQGNCPALDLPERREKPSSCRCRGKSPEVVVDRQEQHADADDERRREYDRRPLKGPLD